MIVAVSGWRHHVHPEGFLDLALLDVMRMMQQPRVFIRVGDCLTGTDRAMWDRALAAQLPHWRYVADWVSYDKAAGPIRNENMLLGRDFADPTAKRVADVLLAFPQPGKRRPHSGTWGCIDKAHEYDIRVLIV